MRALRDALLIGLSLFIIWGVLAAAGIPIPFTTVLIIVGVIVVISFASGVYAQSRRAREAQLVDAVVADQVEHGRISLGFHSSPAVQR